MAVICIFLFILLQYEENRFGRGTPISELVNSDFEVNSLDQLKVNNAGEKIVHNQVWLDGKVNTHIINQQNQKLEF